MTSRLNRKVAIGLVLAGFVTAGASYVRSGQDPAETPRPSIQSGDLTRRELITNQLRELLAPVGVQVPAELEPREDAVTKHLTIHWQSTSPGKTAAVTEQASGSFAVTNSRVSVGSLPRRRSVELAESEIFIAAVNEAGGLVWWQVMTDPRLVRAEAVSESGEISGRVLYRSDVDFLIGYPDDAAIKELRLYHPEWTGERFRLTLLTIISVR